MLIAKTTAGDPPISFSMPLHLTADDNAAVIADLLWETNCMRKPIFYANFFFFFFLNVTCPHAQERTRAVCHGAKIFKFFFTFNMNHLLIFISFLDFILLYHALSL